jgi:hypothetical protein
MGCRRYFNLCQYSSPWFAGCLAKPEVQRGKRRKQGRRTTHLEQTVCDYLSPKELLDRLRLLCKGKTEPDQSLCQQFNQATDDGKNMSAYSELLSEAINSILDAKEESDIDSLFKMGGTTALLSSISGLDDFELICFLVVQ